VVWATFGPRCRNSERVRNLSEPSSSPSLSSTPTTGAPGSAENVLPEGRPEVLGWKLPCPSLRRAASGSDTWPV
jgi:hypothetical protein